MVAMAEGDGPHQHQSTTRRLRSVSVQEIINATAEAHDVDATDYCKFRSLAAGREMAAWLCRHWSRATLEELGVYFGITGTGSVSNLVRRAQTRHDQSRAWRTTANRILNSLELKTQHKA